ncbi:glycoside hydrolase family 38 N-terminal domain-containing protein [Micromonosporaceae bacterium Da 78-11]
MRIAAVTSTELFIGDAADPRQVLQVEIEGPAGDLHIVIDGPGVSGERRTTGPGLVEVGVDCTAAPGTVLGVRVTAETAGEYDTAQAELVVAEPGWTVWMASHFHYDPVWWNTQAAYTTTWDDAGPAAAEFRMDWQHTGFDLVQAHLETARRDPDYKFVLAEVDYLKPYWDTHPQDRAYLRSLLADGRLELMGGTYNEPNTNLTSAESTIRNLVHGVGFQRDVLGGDPRTAWQLDAFGHDPQFPGLVAAAGLDSSSWARGPHHQWGPMLWTHEPGPDGWGDPSVMQFPSEFEWLSPSGQGVLTHYMPAHYSAGWQIDSQPTLAGAEDRVHHLFRLLKRVAATRNVLLPVGTDYTPPAKWVTEIHRDWNARYRWPRFVCALPREFFAAVRAQLDQDGVRAAPQTRDMNPIYTGKDVSFIDTKQAQRHAEALLVDAELFATVAAAHGAGYPHAEIDRAWRQLVYGAHHDAITGSESDQVYLDLLTGWREAYDLAGSVRDRALDALSTALIEPGDDQDPTARRIVVFNPSAWTRTDLVRVRTEFPAPGTLGVAVRAVPFLLEHPAWHDDGSLAAVDVVFRAVDVPATGYRTWHLESTAGPGAFGWRAGTGTAIANDTYRLTVDRARGGCVSRLTDARTGRELLPPGAIGNELLVYDEYPAHPRFHEGPWHLLPTGTPPLASGQAPATSVLVEHSPLGQRITVTGVVGPLRYRQQLTLWHSGDRLEATTEVHDFTGADQLVRLRWPAAVPGAMPVSEVGAAVVGRGFGIIDVDTEQAPWTLDNPAHNFFALSSTARIDLYDLDGVRLHTRAIGVAEVIGDDPRDLVVALARQGVTATSSTAAGARYGRLAVDSNLPDVRIALGRTAFTDAVLAEAGPDFTAELDRQLTATGRARLWVPATEALTAVWVANADLTGTRTLPVLIVIGAAEVQALCAELDQGRAGVRQPAALSAGPDPDLDDYTVALVNRGMPGFAVDRSGALHLSLLRSCTGWPSGVWIDPPRRRATDGSTFQQQHWTHSFDYALVAGDGDWRRTRLVAHGHEVNHPLTATVIGAGPPRERSYVTVEPADAQVVLAALKPTGNPLARGRRPATTVDQVTARVYETTGRPAQVRLRLWTPVTEAHEVDLLEQPAGDGVLPTDAGSVALALSGTGMSQVAMRIDAVPGPTGVPSFPPVHARYWLHNNGPAPIGNLPVTVHLDPPYATVTGPVTLTVSVASDRTEDRAAGAVLLVAPAGWRCEPAALDYDLEPGGHLIRQVVVTAPERAPDGVHWLRARIHPDGLPPVEDVARLVIGVHGPETVEAVPRLDTLRLRPGRSAPIEVDLSSDAAGPVSVHAQLISPWHTWDLFGSPDLLLELPARGNGLAVFDVRVPPGHRPGRWWALIKLGYGGRLHYTAPIEIEVPADE